MANKRWDYFAAGVVVLGDLTHKSVPDALEKYSSEKLFQPLRIKNYKWQFTPQKVVNTAGSLQLRSLDLAKYGQLYKNKETLEWQTDSVTGMGHKKFITSNQNIRTRIL